MGGRQVKGWRVLYALWYDCLVYVTLVNETASTSFFPSARIPNIQIIWLTFKLKLFLQIYSPALHLFPVAFNKLSILGEEAKAIN